MNLRFLGLLFFFAISTVVLAQNSFYETSEIREIRINFSQSNWDALLDSLYIEGEKERILANIVIDGFSYDSVGVRYKGFSSASINRVKNPFNIKLNYIVEGQNHLGLDKLKLSNIIQDPSFVREVLSYEIARKYMPCSEANFTNLYVNDTLIGLYSNVEAVNKEFLEKHFSSTDNVLVKGNPEEIDLYGENANLSNTPGADTLNYASLYTMESDFGWGELYALIDTLNSYDHALEEVLNIDRTLWMHALNYTLLNFDSYIGYAQNYYLYQDDNGLFNPILWDLNMSFGSFRLADASVYFDGFSIAQAKIIDPLSHFNEYSVYPRPLLRKLFENSRYRKMYLAHIRTIIEENFANGNYLNRAVDLHSLIDLSVQADTNKFYSYEHFQNNLYTTVSDLIDYPGIVDLMDGRTTYLSDYPGFQGSPNILEIESYPNEPIAGDTITISVRINQATEVLLAYRNKSNTVFQKQLMNDLGLYGDLVAGDGWYSSKTSFLGSDLDYYIYADNDSAGSFSPARAAYEYYTIEGNVAEGDLVINELMASNSTTVSDSENEYDDWIELYNTSENAISLDGLFLSDEISNLSKWPLPDIVVSPDEYFIVWADSDENQLGTHANFKLSSTGESLFLSLASGGILDSLSYNTQMEDVSYGRFPNGVGEFSFLTPTFKATNNSSNRIPEENELVLNVFPNPVDEQLYVEIKSQLPTTIHITDVVGRLVHAEFTSAGMINMSIPTQEIVPGVYLISVESEAFLVSQKIIKL